GVRPRRRRQNRRGAVGTIRQGASGRSAARLLAVETGRSAPALRNMTPAPSPTKFVPFELERWQSTWENRVKYNLSESGVHPLSVSELLQLAEAATDPLLQVRLGYSQSNGTDHLRERVAAMYQGSTPEQVLVTNGSAEANYVAAWRLIQPGDHVAMLLPNYMQLWGQVQNLGAQVRPFHLHEDSGWATSADAIK